MTQPAYRSVHTRKRFVAWLVIRSLMLVGFAYGFVSAHKRGDTSMAWITGAFIVASVMWIIQIFIDYQHDKPRGKHAA